MGPDAAAAASPELIEHLAKVWELLRERAPDKAMLPWDKLTPAAQAAWLGNMINNIGPQFGTLIYHVMIIDRGEKN